MLVDREAEQRHAEFAKFRAEAEAGRRRRRMGRRIESKGFSRLTGAGRGTR